MGLSVEQLVERVFVEAFPGQSQQMKGLYRFEVEAMIEPVMVEIGQMVAASPDYPILQRFITLPILNSSEIEYSVIVGASIDEGFIFGNTNDYALSLPRLTLSGSPLRVRNQFLEWQIITPNVNASFGVIGVFPSLTTILDPTAWKVLLRIGNSLSVGDLFANGVHYAGAFGVNAGDYFRFQWDTNGDLLIIQSDANRTEIVQYPASGGEVEALSTAGVVFFGDGGQVGIGRIGTGSSTALTPTQADGFYRVDLGRTYHFLTSTFDNTATVQFAGVAKPLSYVPQLNPNGTDLRCDTWYYSLEGEQLILRHGNNAGEVLPANSIQLKGNIIPAPADLPHDYHALVIQKLVDRIRMRAAINSRRR